MKKDGGSFERWHLLLDALCNDRGHYDNAFLASELCRRSGRGRQKDHETAERNLRNWRLGKRLPLRRNLADLSHLLGVDADPQLRARWDRLYRAERGGAGHAAARPHPGTTAPASRLPPMRAGIAMAAALGAVLVAGGLAANQRLAGAGEHPAIAYNARVVLSVGASKLVNGAMTGCGATPPDWSEMQPGIPPSAIGVFEDGGPARQLKGTCGEVPVRAVRFTALRPGIEELKLFGSYLRIEVVEPLAAGG